jgi:hypothetical protein
MMGPMPSTTFTVHTRLSPSETMSVLTDFGPDRALLWANIDDSHFRVHELGPTWAEVTEGNRLGWERERYEWDTAAGTLTIETLDSNLWGPGSGWRYQLTAAEGGTDVTVSLNRVGKSIVGTLVGSLIPIVGGRTLSKQLRSVLAKAEAR